MHALRLPTKGKAADRLRLKYATCELGGKIVNTTFVRHGKSGTQTAHASEGEGSLEVVLV